MPIIQSEDRYSTDIVIKHDETATYNMPGFARTTKDIVVASFPDWEEAREFYFEFVKGFNKSDFGLSSLDDSHIEIDAKRNYVRCSEVDIW